MEGFFAPLVAKACLQVMPAGAGTFNVDSVRVNKIIGGSFGMSTLVNGMVVPRDTEGTSCTFTSGVRSAILIVNRAAGTVKTMANAKIVVFNVEVEATATENKGTVLIESSDQLMNYNRSEELAMEAVCTCTATFAAALSCTLTDAATRTTDDQEYRRMRCQRNYYQLEIQRDGDALLRAIQHHDAQGTCR